MPTTPSSSPTATRAVKEKRRPPLTTLATRLISITRSCRSSPRGLTVSTLVVSIPFIASGQGSELALEDQAPLSCSFGECLDPAVILVTTAVEDAGLDSGFLRPLGQQLSRPLGLLTCGELAQLGLDPVDSGHRVAFAIVNQLGENAAIRAVDGKAGTGSRAS